MCSSDLDQSLYQLYAASLKPQQQRDLPKSKPKRSKKGPALKYTWAASVPVYVRAMVLAEDALFVAGPKHILKDETADDPKTLAEQTAWLTGKKNAQIQAVSPESGEILATTKLASPPVFDGMIAADGNLYVSTMANKLTCLGKSAPLNALHDRIKLQILVDRTSIEIFANDGRVAMSYSLPLAPDNTSLHVFARGGNAILTSLDVWLLKSIWPQ